MGAPTFTVPLSASELPADKCPSGFIVMEVEGLAPGAASDPFNMGLGYITFTHKEGTEGMEKSKYRFHRTNVMIPFLQQIRRTYDKQPSDCEVLEEFTAVVSSDGDHGQVALLVDQQHMAI